VAQGVDPELKLQYHKKKKQYHTVPHKYIQLFMLIEKALQSIPTQKNNFFLSLEKIKINK
jgi:hypothetical protein